MKTISTTRTRIRLAALLTLGAALASGAQKPKPGEAYAIVGGTVFTDSGRALPGAKVVLASKQQPSKKLQEQVSSQRGEFAFRVPPGPAAYILTASLKGFESASKEVEVEAQEQLHKTLLLSPASN